MTPEDFHATLAFEIQERLGEDDARRHLANIEVTEAEGSTVAVTGPNVSASARPTKQFLDFVLGEILDGRQEEPSEESGEDRWAAAKARTNPNRAGDLSEEERQEHIKNLR